MVVSFSLSSSTCTRKICLREGGALNITWLCRGRGNVPLPARSARFCKWCTETPYMILFVTIHGGRPFTSLASHPYLKRGGEKYIW